MIDFNHFESFPRARVLRAGIWGGPTGELSISSSIVKCMAVRGCENDVVLPEVD